MAKYVFLLTPDGEKTNIEKIYVDGLSLAKMRELIGCGSIGLARMDRPIVNGVNYLVYDDGFLLKENLQVNKLASMLYGYLDHGKALCGKVLVTDSASGGMDCAPFTYEFESFVKMSLMFLGKMSEIQEVSLE